MEESVFPDLIISYAISLSFDHQYIFRYIESYTNSVEVNSTCTIEQYHMLNSSDNLLPIMLLYLPQTLSGDVITSEH